MCEALREIWAEDFERARNEGIKQAEIEGIHRMIKSCREIGVNIDNIKEMLVKNYEVIETQAEEYIKLYL